MKDDVVLAIGLGADIPSFKLFPLCRTRGYAEDTSVYIAERFNAILVLSLIRLIHCGATEELAVMSMHKACCHGHQLRAKTILATMPFQDGELSVGKVPSDSNRSVEAVVN